MPFVDLWGHVLEGAANDAISETLSSEFRTFSRRYSLNRTL